MKSINEYLIDLLRRTKLYEMAKNQSKCEDQVASQVRNICENLVLIHYFRISELPTYNLNHWKEELKAAILNASDFKIKKDNSLSRRDRLVKRVFDEEDMRDYNVIYKRAQSKFLKEEEARYQEHELSEDWLDQAILASINQMDDIIGLIVNNSNTEIINWIKKL